MSDPLVMQFTVGALREDNVELALLRLRDLSTTLNFVRPCNSIEHDRRTSPQLCPCQSAADRPADSTLTRRNHRVHRPPERVIGT
jgi:hypothetical protein